MPFAAQAAWTAEMQISDALRKPSFTTVDSMLLEVTQMGVSRTEGTAALAWESCVVPFCSAAGGVWPARRYSAMAAAACASR